MSSSQADIPILNPRAVFGLRTSFIGNIDCINDEEIVYPVGGVLTVNDPVQQKQKFIKLPHKGANVNGLLVSPNRKLIAVAERGSRPTVTLYDVQTYKKKRQLQISSEREVSATDFVAMCFTFDSKCLVTITGEPDWELFVFKCEKGKIESSTKALNANGTGTVSIVACNPNDVNLLVLAGNQLLRILACSESVWRQYGYSKSENVNFTACVWFNQDRILLGTSEGKILVVENGELKAVFWAGDLPMLTFKTKDDQHSSQTSLSVLGSVELNPNEDNEIRSIVCFSKGFAFAYLTGTIHLYQKVTQYEYKKRNVFKVPTVTVKGKLYNENKTVTNKINCIRITPTEDRLIATCTQSQIYTIRLWREDLRMAPEIECVPLGPTLHYGRIGGLSICTWKPLFMTSGLDDRSLRIWNYEQETLEIFKQFQEDIYGIGIHPTGLFAIAGFSDKMRYLTITIDNLLKTREFNIRCCKLCCFSNLGHVFAATNGNVIQVYSTITFEQIFLLKGHSGVISSISWSRNDNKMSTCGHDGAVYEWDVSTVSRLSETIVKSCKFTSTAISSNGDTIFAVGTDGYLREVKKGVLFKELTFLPDCVDCITLSNSDMMLFASGNEGTIYSFEYPLTDPLKYLDYTVHYTTVHHMKISYDDKYVITCAESGVICIWKVMNADGKTIKLHKDFHHTSEVLISKENLQNKLGLINDLKLRIEEVKTEHDYQIRQNEVVHNLRMRDVHQGYFDEIAQLKEKNERMEADHIQEINNINVDIVKIKASNEEYLKELERSYNEKLIFEYNRYTSLEQSMIKMKSQYEKRLKNLENAKMQSEIQITNYYVEQLKQKQVQLEELMERAQRSTNEQELMKEQIEDDADREIFQLKISHEQELREKQDANVRLRAEIGIIRKKYISAQKEMHDLKHKSSTMQNEHVKFKALIGDLEKDITDLKKEITERDNTIQDKERRIFELKSKNQELEKFKFILESKISDLHKQIEPREKTITEQVEKINHLVKELETHQRLVITLDAQISELRNKLKAADSQLKLEVTKNSSIKDDLRKIRMDIHQASGLIQDVPKLIKLVKEIYQRYNGDGDFVVQTEDVEAKNEFMRQRDFLEKTIKDLKQEVAKNNEVGGAEKLRLLGENAALVTEAKTLRTDLKSQQVENRKMQSILGIGNKFMLPEDAEKKLDQAIATKSEVHKKYREKFKESEGRMKGLKDEKKRLFRKIRKVTSLSTKSKNEADDKSK